jgi:hypothetical protein
MSLADEVARLRDEVGEIERALVNVPVKIAHGGGGWEIEEVTEFPEIPQNMPLTFVKRYESETGWGIWMAQSPDTFWVPFMGRFTNLTGEPGS